MALKQGVRWSDWRCPRGKIVVVWWSRRSAWREWRGSGLRRRRRAQVGQERLKHRGRRRWRWWRGTLPLCRWQLYCQRRSKNKFIPHGQRMQQQVLARHPVQHSLLHHQRDNQNRFQNWRVQPCSQA